MLSRVIRRIHVKRAVNGSRAVTAAPARRWAALQRHASTDAAAPAVADRQAAVDRLNATWNSKWSDRKDIHALLDVATNDGKKSFTGEYPKMPIRDAVVAKYPFRMQLEATVPMKMMRNKEYQFPHFKAKLTVHVRDMGLSADESRVFKEIVGDRRAGDKVSFVSREFSSVEACEEKVYALLDGCVTQARALAAQFRAEDESDAALRALASLRNTPAEPYDAAGVRGILLPFEPKRSKISHKRTGLYLWETGLRLTDLGRARMAAGADALFTPRPAGSASAEKREARREERRKRAAHRNAQAQAQAGSSDAAASTQPVKT